MKKVFGILCLMLLVTGIAVAETAQPFSLAEIAGIDFYYSSGVGAWYTTFRLTEDGSFVGDFHDSELGDAGEDYPNGTVYGCTFSGYLSLGETQEDGSCIVTLDAIAKDEGQVAEAIEDGIRYVSAEPYGLLNTDILLLYLPGYPVAGLPEPFLAWSHLNEFETEYTELPYYAFYNPEEEAAFIGFPISYSLEDIVGLWRSGDAEHYEMLLLEEEGTGSITHYPEETGTLLSFTETEGEDGWIVIFGESEDAGFMIYDAFLDQISLYEQNASGEDIVTVFDRYEE